jgi:hypothetical protein
MMQSIAQKLCKHTLRAKFSVIIKLLIILLVTIQFAAEPTPIKPAPRKIQCRTLFEQLDCSLKFGLNAVDWSKA